jgi:glycosyltransferase involved in cell wall biosynthesis
MRIAYIAAGAAGMYCGSCLHDNTLAKALLARGEEVLLVPTYTPLRTDAQDVSLPRVFFGGINAYLQQLSPLFRHTPRWFDKIFDHPALLRLASKSGGNIDPAQLGGLTVSMLRGEQGNQRKELEKLADWLVDEVQPEVVHLSNSMLLGMARRIAERCGPPVICALSGEDIFLEQLRPPYYQQARELLRERAAEVQAFTALNNYYANFMSEYLAVPRSRVHVIPTGLEVADFTPPPGHQRATPARIGYLARICPEKGLHLLIEACELLAEDSSLPAFELVAAGYLGERDRKYLTGLDQRASEGPLRGRFKYLGEVDRAGKVALLQSLTLFSTPTVYRESKGLPTLEALAAGVPVVQPAHGSFPELVTDTGGGLLCEPNNPRDLTGKLAQLLRDPNEAQRMGSAGQAAVQARYNADRLAEETLGLYRKLIAS